MSIQELEFEQRQRGVHHERQTEQRKQGSKKEERVRGH